MRKSLIIGIILFLFISICCFNKCFATQEVMFIDTVEDFNAFANNVKAYHGYEDMIIILRSDLDFKNMKTPVVAGEFKGVFDGQGHKFKNVNLQYDDNSSPFEFGLFEENLGLIRRVIVESGTIVGDGTTGAICGKNSGIIEQCANYVDITACHNIGGIVGWNDDQGIVRYCYNRGNISDKEPGSGGTIGFGGIVGFLYSGTIVNCYNTGIIAPERESHSKGNIMGTYYSENDETEYMDNCFILLSNNYQSSSDEYCFKVDSFENLFYSRINTDEQYFIKGTDGFPVLNMDVMLNSLPKLVKCRVSYEPNALITNYTNMIKEINRTIENPPEENIDIPVIKEDADEYEEEIEEIDVVNNSIKNEIVDETLNELSDKTYVSINNRINENEEFTKYQKEFEEKKENEAKIYEKKNSWLLFGGICVILIVFICALSDSSGKKDDTHIP